MRALCILFFLLLINSCDHNKSTTAKEDDDSGSVVTDAITKDTGNSEHDINSEGESLLILDSSCYSKSFLKALKKVKYKSGPIFIGSQFTNGRDTFPVYTVLKYKEKAFFSYVKPDTLIRLIVTQSFCSSVNFVVDAIIQNKKIHDDGLADLPSMFWLGSETDEDEIGTTYPAMDYFSSTAITEQIRIIGYPSGLRFVRLTIRDFNKSFRLQEQAKVTN